MLTTLSTKTRRQIETELDELKNEWSVAISLNDVKMAAETISDLMELADDAVRAHLPVTAEEIDHLVYRLQAAFDVRF